MSHGVTIDWGATADQDALANSDHEASDKSQVTAVANDRVPMIFKDGSKAMIPRANVLSAVQSGDGEVAHYMVFPDGSHDFIPHENYQGAVADGGKDADPESLRLQKEGAPHAMTLKEGASIAGTTGIQMIPALRGVGRVAQAAKAAKAAADVADIEPSLGSLFKIAKDTAQSAELASGTLESQGAAKFIAVADKGLESARASGNIGKTIAYQAAKTAAQGYQKYAAFSTWLDTKLPGLPIALKMAAGMELAHEGWHKLFGDDKEDARKELFGDK